MVELLISATKTTRLYSSAVSDASDYFFVVINFFLDFFRLFFILPKVNCSISNWFAEVGE
jgi:hypothetical protein